GPGPARAVLRTRRDRVHRVAGAGPGRVAAGAGRRARDARARRRRPADDRDRMILGLDTATADTAVALWAPGGPEVERRDEPPLGARPAHAGKLLLLVEEVLDDAGANWDDVERIAVGVGPGSFTGL